MADDKQSFPRFPENRWWQLRKQFLKTLPKTVDPSYLSTIFKIETPAAKNLVPVLKQLGLISEEGKPTELANTWRHDDTYADACKAMLHSIYPQGLLDVEPGPEIDKSNVARWITKNTKLGDGAANGSASLYKLIVEADQSKEPDPQSAKTPVAPKKPAGPRKAKDTPSQEASDVPATESPMGVQNTSQSSPLPVKTSTTPTVHLDIQIHISPEASNEQIEKIFESMGKHIFNRGMGE